MGPVAHLLTSLLADPAPITTAADPRAELITVTFGGITGLIIAITGLRKVGQRRREANDDGDGPAPILPTDPKDLPASLRERLSALEARDEVKSRQIEELFELARLHRAADVVIENATRPRRRPPKGTS